VQELFEATLSELEVTINFHPPGELPIPSIAEYVEQMRILLWDTAFSYEFEGKGVHKNHLPEFQIGLDKAVARVLFRYFKFVLYSRNATSKTPSFFPSYLDRRAKNCMISDEISSKWKKEH
jgi:hypothetical protein